MTVQDLIARLEKFDPATEVRIAVQPQWPFEHGIDVVEEVAFGQEFYPVVQPDGTWAVVKDGREEPETVFDGLESEEAVDEWVQDKLAADGRTEPVVYIAEAEQMGYLPGEAKRALGW